VDFVVAVPRERLADLYFGHRGGRIYGPDHYRGGWIDSVGGMPLFKVRLFLEGRGIDADVFLMENDFQRAVMSRRIREQVEGKPVHLITAEDLILFKLLAGRPRDLLDTKDVLFMQGQLDETSMRRWAGPLGVGEQLEQALAEGKRCRKPFLVHLGFLWVTLERTGLPMPSRRTFASGILPSALSKETSLRHPGYARFPTPLDWHRQALKPIEFPEGPPFSRPENG
jgi:hypothetical protein